MTIDLDVVDAANSTAQVVALGVLLACVVVVAYILAAREMARRESKARRKAWRQREDRS